jgi:hypothetical protein
MKRLEKDPRESAVASTQGRGGKSPEGISD